jgi:hypothetical protein
MKKTKTAPKPADPPALTQLDAASAFYSCLVQTHAENHMAVDKLEPTASLALLFLFELANKGNVKAAKAIHGHLTYNLGKFGALCRQHPKIFEPIARETTKWPGLLSCENHFTEQNAALVQSLHLGQNSGLNYSGKQWSRDTVETGIALKLYGRLQVYRDDWRLQMEQPERMKAFWEQMNKRMGRPAGYRPSMEKPAPLTPEQKEKARLDREAFELAKNLKPLNRQNYKAWFKAAEPAFIALYGNDFENRKCFSPYWHPNQAAYRDASDNARRAQIRRDIKAKIKQGFHSIAPKP